ncbi:hypothetical protein ACFQ5N_02230 [Lutibacter holmesii]|uniref:Uncharacterized protein n=1 Tax=Lutibacter holmesii TaxID=1137985 RepID=A0ABW3WMD6_9FLAO
MEKSQLEQQHKAQLQELKQLRKKYAIARKIVTAEGFYQTWFNSLRKFESGAAAFEALNQLHYNTVLPPRYKYSSYVTFLNVIKRRNSKK